MEISLSTDLKRYRGDRGLVTLMASMGCFVFIALSIVVNPNIRFLYFLVGGGIAIPIIRYLFGARFRAMMLEDNRIKTADHQAKQTWFKIVTQQWVLLPRSDYDNAPFLHWLATITADGTNLMVAIDKDMAGRCSLDTTKHPIAVRFPRAQYFDGKLGLNPGYDCVEFKYN